MACFKVSGTLVPAGTTRLSFFPSRVCTPAEFSGCKLPTDWPKQADEINNHNAMYRINFISPERICRAADKVPAPAFQRLFGKHTPQLPLGCKLPQPS